MADKNRRDYGIEEKFWSGWRGRRTILGTLRMATAVGSICILVTSGCFFRIYLVLRYHHRKIRIQTRPTTTAPNSEERRYRRSVLGMFMVYIVLLVCYLPYLCITCVIVVRGTNTTSRLLFELARTLVYANSAINPMIYCWRLQDLRTAVRERFRCV